MPQIRPSNFFIVVKTIQRDADRISVGANKFPGAGDPWQEARDVASQIKTRALVIDTENSTERLGRRLATASDRSLGIVDHLDKTKDLAGIGESQKPT